MELGLVWLTVAVGSAGIGIILFTVFVRLVLSPLQILQLRNAKAMQRIQPMVKELQKKHGKDRQKLSEETMALYREHNVNPAMGCLPTLLQFPILIGLFYALLHLGASPTGYPGAIIWSKVSCNGHSIANWNQWFQTCYAIKNAAGHTQQIFDLFHANFLWLSHGLGKPDPFFILPLLAGATQWIQSRMMLTQSNDPQQQMMNNMMNFMPLMIVFFAANYPSGLSLYWVTSTLIGILIQYRITGWGLLRSPLGQLGFPSPARAFGSAGSRSAGARPRKAAPMQSQPLAPVEEVEPNGQDGNGEKPRDTTGVNRQRKKANRARGGRGGGRRG
jgi:YidC/Oxa1 family membrane protein insertase